MQVIYADNNATTKVAPEVREAILPFLTDDYFNPSSMYEPAREIGLAIAEARSKIAGCLGVTGAEQIVFTSCATESNNAAIRGTTVGNPAHRHVITTAVEHPAVLEVCKDLQRGGYDVTFLPVDEQGRLSMSGFVLALRPGETLLVTIIHANNETGVIFPIEELSRVTKQTDPGIVFHTDATQSVGKVPSDLQGGCQYLDLLSFSGHKLHAPKGIGALYVKRGTRCRPLLIGGHQEGGRRAGTENVPYIVGLGEATRLAIKNLDEDNTSVRERRDRLEKALKERIPHICVNGEGAPRLPNTSNVSCHYVEGEAMLHQLSDRGICASSGSACTSGSLEPSHVLRAMNVPFTAVHGSKRTVIPTARKHPFTNTSTESSSGRTRHPDRTGGVGASRKVSQTRTKRAAHWDRRGRRGRGATRIRLPCVSA